MKSPLHNGKAAIFDLDGTLLDTLDDLAAAGNHVLQQHGFAPVPIENFRYYVGDGMRNMVRRALCGSLMVAPESSDIDESLVTKLLVETASYYEENWSNATRLYVGIAPLLKELAKRRIPFAVCSNKGYDFVEKMVNYYFFDVHFSGIAGQRDDTPLKPDITGAMRLADAMNTRPQDVVFIGDTKVDMLTANAAGMFAAGVSWGFRPKEELLENGAQIIVDEPDSLLRLFG